VSQIVSELKNLLRETEGLPPFRRDKAGTVQGWPTAAVAHLSATISSLVRSSSEDLREAIIEIEIADKTRVPEGLIALLMRAAWDAPAAPDLVQVMRARNQGANLRDGLAPNRTK